MVCCEQQDSFHSDLHESIPLLLFGRQAFSCIFIFVYTSTETRGVSLVFREKQLHFLFYRLGECYCHCTKVQGVAVTGAVSLFSKVKKVPAGMIYGSWKAIQTVNDGQMPCSPMAGSKTGSVTNGAYLSSFINIRSTIGHGSTRKNTEK